MCSGHGYGLHTKSGRPMSTRGSTFYDDDIEPMEWRVEPRAWCPSCCVPNCGCPDEPTIPPNIIRGEE